MVQNQNTRLILHEYLSRIYVYFICFLALIINQNNRLKINWSSVRLHNIFLRDSRI